jgi:hypothetical protein
MRSAVPAVATYVRFSNRPFGVKRFQAIHHSIDVAHGLVVLFGLGTKALPSWDSKTRWNNLLSGLAGRLTAGPSRHTISPHPSSREINPHAVQTILPHRERTGVSSGSQSAFMTALWLHQPDMQ